MQRVARQYRRCFVISAVDGRLAAPQVIIVHTRQVVMHERIDMDRFDRCTNAQCNIAVDMEKRCGCRYQ